MNIKRIIFIFIIILVINMLSATSCDFIKFIDDKWESGNKNKTVNATEETTEENLTVDESAKDNERVLAVHSDFYPYLQINEDTVGYIKIENTAIDYPVVFNGDNDYYLHHDFYKREDKYGAVFMDMSNHGAILSKNTLLHGHNFYDGRRKIFEDLDKFKQKDFFVNNKTIIFNNLYSIMEWEIFAVYVIHAKDYYVKTSFASDEEFFEFIERIKSSARLWRDYTPSADDYLLTLNTCTDEFDEAHTIIHAKLVKKKDNWEE